MSFTGAQSFYAKMMAEKAEKAKAEAAATSSSAAVPSTEQETKPSQFAPPSVKAPAHGTLVMFGSTNYAEMGKKIGSMLTATNTDATPNLLGPHRLLSGLGDSQIVRIATGGTSAHCVAIGAGGEAFVWGRNESGQLGLGDNTLRATPTRVASLETKPVASAATGKAHTVFLTRAGELLACGHAKQGCVGPSVSKNTVATNKPIAVTATGGESFTAVAAGTNFNLAIDSHGDVWSWGWSEFGVLGNGTDGEYNAKESSVKLSYTPQGTPRRVLSLCGLKCIDVACGTSHCAAISGEGVVYTWGNGGYGRLGHKDQKDVWTPKALEECRGRQVRCGVAHTTVLGWPVLRNGQVCSGAPSLFMMGRVRSASQNSWMYPKTEDELRGWDIHTFDCGAGHNVVHADDAVIAWGSGCCSGELGFGEGGKKSSASPAKVDSLDTVSVAQVACGVANTILLVESGDVVKALPEFVPMEPPPGEGESSADAGPQKGAPKGKAAGKRPAEPGAGGAKGKKSKK